MATKTSARTRTSPNGAGDSRRTLAEYVYGTAVVIDVPVAKLVTESFQRDVNGKALREMVGGYDPNQLQIPTVHPLEDGTFSLLDGQHRAAMAKEIGLETVTCQRITGLTYEQRAELFTNLQRNRRWLTPSATYKSELEAKKPWAIEVTAVLAARGLTVTSSHSPTGIMAVGTLKDIYTLSGSVTLGRVVDVALGAWPDDDPRRFAGAILTALYLYIDENKKADLDRLASGLQKVTAQQLIAKGQQRWYGWRAVDSRGGSKVEAVKDEVKKLYLKARV